MYASVIAFQVKPDQMDQTIRIWQEASVPSLRQAWGWKSARLLTDPHTGKGMVVGIWETEADARAYESSGQFQEQSAKFGAVQTAPPSRSIYEVSLEV